jgi:hypothetical protein
VSSLPPDFDPIFGTRPELGALTRDSGQRLNEISSAQVEGAENLLMKAMASLSAGQTDRAEKLIQRVAAMPYDPREEETPGIRAALMLVYDLVVDEFEDSEVGDTAWLDVALAVHEQVDGAGKAHLASTLNGLVLQRTMFTLDSEEKRRIRNAVGDAPMEADLGEGPDATVAHRRDVITSLVRTTMALEAAYVAAGEG